MNDAPGKLVTFTGGEDERDRSSTFIVGKDRLPLGKPVEVSATRAKAIEKAAAASGMKVKITDAKPSKSESEDES